MNTWQKNLTAFLLRNELPAGFTQGLLCQDYLLKNTPVGMLVLQKVQDNQVFNIHSPYNPLAEAERWVGAQDAGKPVLVVLGLGLGYHLRELIKYVSGVTRIIVVQQGLARTTMVFETVDIADILVRIELVTADSQEKLASELAEKLAGIRDWNLLIYPPELKVMPAGPLKELFYNWQIQKATVERRSPLMLENFKQNQTLLKNIMPINKLFGTYRNKPLLIAAGGPSLDEVIPYIKKIKDLFVFSVGTALGPLRVNGITPDLAIITDPHPILLNQIKGIRDIPLILLPTVTPELFNYQGPEYLALQEGFTPGEKLAEQMGLELVQTGGSVSTTALDIAIKLGNNPIIFAGLDLAYPGNRYHAAGVDAHGSRVAFSEVSVPDNSGGLVYSTRVFGIFRSWVEQRIAREPDRVFINTSVYGSAIKGTRICPPEQLSEFVEQGSI